MPVFREEGEGREGRERVALVGVACGQHHTVCLDAEGAVYHAGRAGPLSHADGFARVRLPDAEGKSSADGFGERASLIASGLHHCAAVNATHTRVFTWGRGREGQLGHGSSASPGAPGRGKGALDLSSPCEVRTLAARHVLGVSCGDYYTMAICGHVEYDKTKVDLQLEDARMRYRSVVKSGGSPENQGAKAGMDGHAQKAKGIKAKKRTSLFAGKQKKKPVKAHGREGGAHCNGDGASAGSAGKQNVASTSVVPYL